MPKVALFLMVFYKMFFQGVDFSYVFRSATSIFAVRRCPTLSYEFVAKKMGDTANRQKLRMRNRPLIFIASLTLFDLSVSIRFSAFEDLLILVSSLNYFLFHMKVTSWIFWVFHVSDSFIFACVWFTHQENPKCS